MVGVLSRMRVLTEADLGLLEAWCAIRSVFIQASRHLSNSALINPDRDGTQRRDPWLLARSRAIDQIRALAQEFGFSPSARTKLSASPVPIDPVPDKSYRGKLGEPRSSKRMSLEDYLAYGDRLRERTRKELLRKNSL
jgi:P27 family predicted phage terminase small subunit